MFRYQRFLRPMTALSLLPLFCLPAIANGLYENRPWQFETSADKANKAIVTDMIERKKGGYYDAFGPGSNTFYNMDCYITASSVGNESTSAMDARTSSPDPAPGSNLTSDSTGNEALNAGGGGGPLNSDQSNSGTQSSNVSDNTSAVGNIDASNGITQQTLNNDQDNLGDQYASVKGSTACNFSQGGN